MKYLRFIKILLPALLFSCMADVETTDELYMYDIDSDINRLQRKAAGCEKTVTAFDSTEVSRIDSPNWQKSYAILTEMLKDTSRFALSVYETEQKQDTLIRRFTDDRDQSDLFSAEFYEAEGEVVLIMLKEYRKTLAIQIRKEIRYFPELLLEYHVEESAAGRFKSDVSIQLKTLNE
jgi:hypothetical protein